MKTSAELSDLLQHPDIWRGQRQHWTSQHCLSTGFTELDAELPGGGWPLGALTELLFPHHGLGELQLLLPALQRLQQHERWIALIAPPFIPYAPAWQTQALDLSRFVWVKPRNQAEHLWAYEQMLRSGRCGAVLSWPGSIPSFPQLRRLQLAAQNGRCLAVTLNCTAHTYEYATPAALRVQIARHAHGLSLRLMKRRGAWAGAVVQLKNFHSYGMDIKQNSQAS